MTTEKRTHPLTEGQRQAIVPLLQQRQAIDAQIGTILNIAITDAKLPPVEGGWSLNAQTMCLHGEVAGQDQPTNGLAKAALEAQKELEKS